MENSQNVCTTITIEDEYSRPNWQRFFSWLALLATALTLFNLPVVLAKPLEKSATKAPVPSPVCRDLQCFEGMEPKGYDLAVQLAISGLSENDLRSLELLDGTALEEAKDSIALAASKYSVPVGFFTGIAFAESGAHKNYYYEPDRQNCHNAWGLKPVEGMRPDGSFLICFANWDESANYLGQLLKEKFIDRGAKTVVSIAPYYKCGGLDGSENCLATLDNWIRNVKGYSVIE